MSVCVCVKQCNTSLAYVKVVLALILSSNSSQQSDEAALAHSPRYVKLSRPTSSGIKETGLMRHHDSTKEFSRERRKRVEYFSSTEYATNGTSQSPKETRRARAVRSNAYTNGAG